MTNQEKQDREQAEKEIGHFISLFDRDPDLKELWIDERAALFAARREIEKLNATLKRRQTRISRVGEE